LTSPHGLHDDDDLVQFAPEPHRTEELHHHHGIAIAGWPARPVDAISKSGSSLPTSTHACPKSTVRQPSPDHTHHPGHWATGPLLSTGCCRPPLQKDSYHGVGAPLPQNFHNCVHDNVNRKTTTYWAMLLPSAAVVSAGSFPYCVWGQWGSQPDSTKIEPHATNVFKIRKNKNQYFALHTLRIVATM
jgi:hypothetical protein